jgi:hypothetical protein
MAASLPEGQVFVAITEGFGRMPATLRYSAQERWDVINYLRGLTPGVQPAPPGDARLRAVRFIRNACATCTAPPLKELWAPLSPRRPS